jgi:hypothetical protein
MDLGSLNTAGFQKGYRIFSWTVFAGLMLMIFLVLHKSPPPPVASDPAAAARAQQKFASADQAKASGVPSDVKLDSTELNSYLAQNLQMAGSIPSPSITSSGTAPGIASGAPAPAPADLPHSDPPAALPPNAPANNDQQQLTQQEVESAVRDVKVDMDGDLIKAYVVFNVHGEDLSLELDGHLSTENGYMKFDPVAGKLGSLPLPQSVLDAAVNQLMNSPENREKLRLPDDIGDVQIQNGQAVVSYK